MRLFTILVASLVVYSVSGAALVSQNKLPNDSATKNNSSANSVSQVTVNDDTAEVEVEASTNPTVDALETIDRIDKMIKDMLAILDNMTTTNNPPSFILPPMVLPKPPCHKPIPPFNLPRPPFGLPHPPTNIHRPQFGFPQPSFQPAPFHGPRPFSGFGSQGFVNGHEHFGGRFGNNQRFGFRQNW
uniref:Uncharacterized protein n=1 Tax=Tetranychus urticae TaxID=32264 RepID=T1KUN6_TETUR